MSQILKPFEKLFRVLGNGRSANIAQIAQKALFKGLKYVGEESDRRLIAESNVIDLQIAMAEQSIRLYSKLPPGDAVFEAERKTEIERYQAILPILQGRKSAKIAEQNELRVEYLRTVSDLIRKFPGIDNPAGGT